MPEFSLEKILVANLPEKAVAYCFELWRKKPFRFILSKSRHSKAGDFSARHAGYTITINRDLNRYQFLITYIHEVAHLLTHKKFGRSVTPHGQEWKKEFKQLMQPLLTTEVFPPSILNPLITHLENPKASTFSDPALTKELRLYDSTPSAVVVLDHLAAGSLFKLRGQLFKKGELRRTRFYCHEIKTNRKYLIPRLALVEQVQPV
ncbi:MAG: SprT-like domain-containing protein [Flammeovirgaceae bacterium]|nr:MAG: SprT-like domain-containing protein [Flammeovirgaceae bacterium]